MIASHPLASGLTGTNKPEDEGQHVQDLYPIARTHGGPGRWAFAPEMHMDETSSLCTPESAEKLMRCWEPYVDTSQPVLVEKSPPNMLKSRFLQGLFPSSSFIIVIRHPIAVAEATAKWTRTSRRSLIAHWVRAHEEMMKDLPHLERCRLVRYEELVENPQAEYRRVLEFLGLPPASATVGVRAGVNEKYYRSWENGNPWARHSARSAVRDYSRHVEPFGYRLTSPYIVPDRPGSPNGLPTDLQPECHDGYGPT
jgi:hypothetical protein